MEKGFPIVPVFKEAISLPLANGIEAAKSLGILFGMVIIAGIVIGVIGAALGLADVFANFSVDNIDPSTILPLLLVYFLFILFVIGTFAYIFNRWVRLSALGKERAKFDTNGSALKAALVNGIKFILIGIIIILASFVLQAVLAAFGMVEPAVAEGANFMEALANQSQTSTTMTILQTIMYCIIYSLFSSNLTNTALDSDKEDLTHPHTMDFAIVLIMIYAILIVPSTLALSLGLQSIWGILQIVLGFYVMFAIPAAHGVRYRACVGSAAHEADMNETSGASAEEEVSEDTKDDETKNDS